MVSGRTRTRTLDPLIRVSFTAAEFSLAGQRLKCSAVSRFASRLSRNARALIELKASSATVRDSVILNHQLLQFTDQSVVCFCATGVRWVQRKRDLTISSVSRSYGLGISRMIVDRRCPGLSANDTRCRSALGTKLARAPFLVNSVKRQYFLHGRWVLSAGAPDRIKLRTPMLLRSRYNFRGALQWPDAGSRSWSCLRSRTASR
jgi:hypothetical protein